MQNQYPHNYFIFDLSSIRHGGGMVQSYSAESKLDKFNGRVLIGGFNRFNDRIEYQCLNRLKVIIHNDGQIEIKSFTEYFLSKGEVEIKNDTIINSIN